MTIKSVETMMTTRGLAERWACSVGRLANLRSQSRGPRYLRVGTAIRYPLSAVQEYEAMMSVETVESAAA